ncbi:Quinone oxidoreductase (plasmid) [Rhodococcus sp. WAY2]|nr:Quinone oxidoreductase [Rhodococcus sp. WAY2]
MKAAFHASIGGVDVLEVGEFPIPTYAPDEVLVEVKASSLDRLDIFSRDGSHGVRKPLPHIGGRDMAGTVVAMGSDAARLNPHIHVGDAVVASGKHAHAEFAVAPALLTFPMPSTCSYIEAGGIPTSGHTAYNAVTRARAKDGEIVLVTAGGSGVGSFAIQVARASGCTVVTTVGSAEKCAAALKLGANEAVDHSREDIGESVKRITDGAGVNVAIDGVGAAVWDQVFDLLQRDGRYVSTGVTAGARVQLHLGRAFVKGLEIHGIGRPSVEHFRRSMLGLLEMIELGKVQTVVDSVINLDQIKDAHLLMESSSFFGKIILEVS